MFDDAGGTGDATARLTYDRFNQPLATVWTEPSIRPRTECCPISTVDKNG